MNTSEFTSIKSVCTNSVELLKSKDFLRGIKIILEKVDNFEEKNIYPLFEKLSILEALSEKEKTLINTFIKDEKVKQEGKELLLKLSDSPNEAKTKNHDEQVLFTEFLSEILNKETGYDKIQQCISETFTAINFLSVFRKK